MTVLAEYSFTKARSSLTELIDSVQRMVPAVIKPRKKSEEPSVILARSLLLALLRENQAECALTARLAEEPDRSITVTLESLDIATNANTREAAMRAAAEEAVEYSKEYLDPANIGLYLRSPNRRPHLPLVMRIALCNSIAEVLEIFSFA